MNIYIDLKKEDITTKPTEDNMWVSYCDKLGLDSFGKTEEEAENNILSIITHYIESLMERGILISRLREKGISIGIERQITDYPLGDIIELYSRDKDKVAIA